MEVTFENEIHPVCIAAHPHISDRLAIGFIDGNISIYDVDVLKNQLRVLGGKKLKQAVRSLVFSYDGAYLYSIGENRSLCTYDLLNMKRIRCIGQSHDEKPSSLSYLPSSSTKGQQIATGCENGEIRTWDLRCINPLISTYNDQEDDINGFAVYKNTLLAASSDGTLGAYELRKRKLLMRSEPMHNELLCVEVGDKFTYVGSGDGYLEVFNNGEYGNLLERIICKKGKGTDCVKFLRPNLIVTASCEEDQLRLFNLNPYQKLNVLGEHVDGVSVLETSADKKWICSAGYMRPTIKFWDLEFVLQKLPLIRAAELSKKKIAKKLKRSNFFDELCEESSDEDEEESMDDEEQEPSDLNELVDKGESTGEVTSDESDNLSASEYIGEEGKVNNGNTGDEYIEDLEESSDTGDERSSDIVPTPDEDESSSLTDEMDTD